MRFLIALLLLVVVAASSYESVIAAETAKDAKVTNATEDSSSILDKFVANKDEFTGYTSYIPLGSDGYKANFDQIYAFQMFVAEQLGPTLFAHVIETKPNHYELWIFFAIAEEEILWAENIYLKCDDDRYIIDIPHGDHTYEFEFDDVVREIKLPVGNYTYKTIDKSKVREVYTLVNAIDAGEENPESSLTLEMIDSILEAEEVKVRLGESVVFEGESTEGEVGHLRDYILLYKELTK